MKYLFISFVCLSLSFESLSQKGKAIEGKWDACTSMTLDSSQNCSSATYATYDFHADGTYDDSRAYSIKGKKYNYHGTWSLNGNLFIIDATDENGISIPAQKHEIFWINESLFYTTGTEGPNGPLVYTYYRKH
jgi:hypothetical protein